MHFKVKLHHLVHVERFDSPPVTAMRMVSHTNALTWWSLRNCGYFEKMGLFSGSSISPSIAINPSLRALLKTSKEHLE